MSLLVNESYANSGTPLWASASGGPINGNLTVNGNIETKPDGLGTVTTGGLYITKPNAVIAAALGYNVGGDAVINCQGGGNSIVFTQLGSTGNSRLTPSAQGANQDLLRIGGVASANQLKLADTGAAAVMGTSTLVAGQSPVINTTACLGPQTYILLTRTDVNASTSLGELRVRQRNAGNFLVESDVPATPGIPDPNDVSSFIWVIINPA